MEATTTPRRTAGVLGGLGPLATVQFLSFVIDNTVVEVEQDHVDLMVSQRSSTPDRTAAIMGAGPSPAPRMAADATLLEGAGADFVVIPCNTASTFIGAVEEAVKVPVVSIVGETLDEVLRREPAARSVGLMATDGTLAARIYHDAAAERGLEVVEPTEEAQQRIMAMIYDGVKVGRNVSRAEFFGRIEELRDAGAEVVVTGCTELSVLCARFGVRGGHVVDSLTTLARRTIELAGGRLTPM